MTRQIICPNCRSKLEAVGYADVLAPKISVVPCPVCNTPQWLDSGWIPPVRWGRLNVITEYTPTKLWEDIKKDNPTLAKAAETPPKEASETVYKDTKLVPDVITNAVKGIGGNLAIGAGIIVIVVILVLILLIKRTK
ncbi:MAG: hypothetical protein V1933_08000 [Candidatus Omnitrophota bacterium]